MNTFQRYFNESLEYRADNCYPGYREACEKLIKNGWKFGVPIYGFYVDAYKNIGGKWCYKRIERLRSRFNSKRTSVTKSHPIAALPKNVIEYWEKEKLQDKYGKETGETLHDL